MDEVYFPLSEVLYTLDFWIKGLKEGGADDDTIATLYFIKDSFETKAEMFTELADQI